MGVLKDEMPAVSYYFKNDGILTKSESYITSMAHSQFK